MSVQSKQTNKRVMTNSVCCIALLACMHALLHCCVFWRWRPRRWSREREWWLRLGGLAMGECRQLSHLAHVCLAQVAEKVCTANPLGIWEFVLYHNSHHHIEGNEITTWSGVLPSITRSQPKGKRTNMDSQLHQHIYIYIYIYMHLYRHA